MPASEEVSLTRRVFLVVQRARHHAVHSGYHRLAEWLEKEGATPITTHPFPRRGTWRLARPFVRRAGLTWYGPEAFLTEMWAAGLASWRAGVLHFLQGENSYRYAGVLPGNQRVFRVATMHLPPSVLSEYVHQLHHLERLEAIIFLAQNQFAMLDRLHPQPAAYLVPHGVDTDFYIPGSRPGATTTCLFVGNFLRDFETLDRVIGEVQRLAPGVRFRLVVLPQLAAHWQGRPGVEVCSGLDDEALRRAYQEAALLLLPLRDCAANNAVLEAMACGLPVVASDVGGIRSYADDRCACLVRLGDVTAMTQAVLDLLGDTAAREAMGRAGRQQVLKFSWPQIARRMMAVYEALR
jgi:glycosyltransferase involved in cell wall biosynthesis